MLTWDTLIFILPIVVAIVLGTGALSGLGGDFDADLEGPQFDGPDVDVDIDADVGAIDVDVDVDADAEGESSSWAHVLAWLGIGRAPLMVLLTVGLLAFGITGLLLRPVVGALVALAIAVVASLLATSGSGRVLARYMPTSETYARRRDALVGCMGTARLAVTRTFGVAQIRDESGTLHEVRCRIDAVDDGVTIAKGSPLVIVDYEDSSATYTVAALNHDVTARPAATRFK